MPTSTGFRPGRAGSAGRFARPSGRPSSRPTGRPSGRASGRPSGPRRSGSGQTRTFNVPRKRQPQRSAAGKVLSTVGGLAGAGKKGRRSSSSSRTKKPAGLAMLAGAAGLAFKNRDKLTSMVGKRGRKGETDTLPAESTTPLAATDAGTRPTEAGTINSPTASPLDPPARPQSTP